MRRSYLLTTLSVSFVFIVLTLMPGCSGAPNYWVEAKPGQKKILVSFPPLYAMTHAVAGEDAYVLSMLTTQGPHDYQYAATDLFKVKNADLLIFNGLTLDEVFVDKMLLNHTNARLQTLNVGEVMDKKHHKWLLHGEVIHHGDHVHGEHDPHLWLGPKQAILMTKIIADKLGEIDPAHAKNYNKRADDFTAKLQAVEAYGIAAFKDKENKKFITTHEAFGYFAKAFKLKIVATIQKQPGLDPDAVGRGKLVELCKAPDGPRVLAVEPQYSRVQAEALQADLKRDGIDVKIVSLDPLETAVIPEGRKFNPDPEYYLKTMRENIDSLAKALP